MRGIASERPGTGACTLATAMKMWLWTLSYTLLATDADGNKLYHAQRQGVTFALADALCWLLAARCQILDVLELEAARRGRCGGGRRACRQRCSSSPTCAMCSRRGPAGEVSRICAELVFGYNRHPAWDAEGCEGCFHAHELEEYEGLDAGHLGLVATDVIGPRGMHPSEGRPVRGLRGIG